MRSSTDRSSEHQPLFNHAPQEATEQMPTLSIITVTYNRADVLKHNLASVSGQTFTDIEHIIVDNMSSDGTDQMVSDYRTTAPYPVIYIREPDTGIYNAMNKGLRTASGVWTHILNSDDGYAKPTVLQELFRKELGGYDLIANAVLMVEDCAEQTQHIWIPNYDDRINHYNFPHTGTITRTSFYRIHGYYREDFRIVSDAVYGIEHYPKANYTIVESPLVIMRRGGASESPSFRNIYEKMLCLLCYHRFPLLKKAEIGAKEFYRFLRGLAKQALNKNASAGSWKT